MPKKTEKIYWDACCFLAILNKEDEAERCMTIVNEAKEGEIDLFISPLTMAETVRPKGSDAPISRDVRDKVLAFFENDYVRMITFNREVARISLDYCWDYGLQARDALHLAFAVYAGCNALETVDQKFISKIPSGLPIQVRRPIGTGQTRISDVSEETTEE